MGGGDIQLNSSGQDGWAWVNRCQSVLPVLVRLTRREYFEVQQRLGSITNPNPSTS